MNKLFVAKTILEQLKTLGLIEVWSWGAHAFKGFTEKHASVFGLGPINGGLVFRVNGRLFKGHVAIVLMPYDEYTIMFGQLRKGNFKMKNKIDHVFFDELISIIDSNIETATK